MLIKYFIIFIILFFYNFSYAENWITKKNKDEKNCKKNLSISELNSRTEFFISIEKFDEAFICSKIGSDTGDAFAIANLGWHYQTGKGIEKNYKKANELFRESIKKENLYSYNRLALSYLNGWGVKKDIEKAFSLHLKAAKKGDDYSQAEVGWHYLNGEGVIKNEKLAYKWFKKSADQENTYAQSMLGWMVAIGTGTDQNYKEGFNISKKAADKGDDYAQANIGWHYVNGFGVEKNIELALEWYEKAKEKNNEFAIKEINRINKIIANNKINEDVQNEESTSWITKKTDEKDTIIKDRNDEAVAKKAEKQINENIQIKFIPIDEQRIIIKTTRLRESYNVDSNYIRLLETGEKVWVSKKLDDENIVGEWVFIETEDNEKGYILGDKLGLLGLEANLNTSDEEIDNPNILDIEWGKYYALVIGNNNYEFDFDPLKTAVNDAVEIADILENKYGFEVTLSLNATRETIYKELKILSKVLKENDNLLIYYAGHGTVDIKNNEGYWLPIGAKEDAEWTWFSVSELVNQIERFSHIKHILVIADSCFSGTIFQPGHKGSKITDKDNLLNLDKFYKKKNNAKARIAISSGFYEYVPDAIDGSTHSPFALTLLNILKENNNYLLADELFDNLEKNITIYPTNQTPIYGSLVLPPGQHDPNGDFIFVPISLINQD